MIRRPLIRLLAVPVLLTGCGLVPNDPVPAEPVPGDGPQSITDCVPPLAFEGEATIADLGLAIPGLAAEATRPGTIRITADTVNWEQFAPPGVPAVVPEGQMLCVTWADGSGMTTLLSEPFTGVGAIPADEAGSGSFPWTPILFGIAVVLVVGVSWIAFRRESAPAA
jgi:hypothetical protein